MDTSSKKPAACPVRSETLVVSGILGALLLLKLIYLVFYAQRSPFYSTPIGDSALYLDWARSIITGEFWRQPQQFLVFYRAPLYPFLLVLPLKVFGSATLPMYLLQILLGTVNLYITYVIARRLFGHRVGIIAIILAGLYAPLVFKETKLVSTTITISLLLLAAYFLIKASDHRPRLNWFLSGVFAGLATLTWGGIIVFVPVVFLFWLLMKPRPKFQRVLLLAAGCFLAMLPATLHNLFVGNDWVLVNSNSGYTFYQGNNPAASGTIVHPPEVYERAYDGRFPTGIADQQQFDLGYASSHLKPTKQGEKQELVKPSEASRFWLGRALSWIGRNPGAFIRLEFNKIVLALSNYEFPSNYYLNVEQDQVPVLRIFLMPFALILALGVLGLVVTFGERDRNWPLLVLIVTTLLILIVFYAGSRYRLPLVLPLCVFAGAGAMKLFDRWRERKLGALELAVFIPTLLLSWIFCSVPLEKRYAFTSALGFRNIGEAWLNNARSPARAKTALNRSLSIFDRYDQFDRTPLSGGALNEILVLRGDAFTMEGKYDSAAIDFRAAFAADPRAVRPLGRLALNFMLRATTPPLPPESTRRALTDTALSYVADWRQRDSSGLDPIALEGDVHMLRGDTARALENYGQLIEMAPRYEPAYRAICAIRLARRDTAAAIKNCLRLLQSDSGNVYANVLLGDIFLSRGETSTAQFRYERGAAETLAMLPPQRLALLQASRRNHADAAALLERAIGRFERNPHLLRNVLQSPSDAQLYLELKLRLALSQAHQGKWDAAIAQLAEVLRIDPGNRTALQLNEAAQRREIPSVLIW